MPKLNYDKDEAEEPELCRIKYEASNIQLDRKIAGGRFPGQCPFNDYKGCNRKTGNFCLCQSKEEHESRISRTVNGLVQFGETMTTATGRTMISLIIGDKYMSDTRMYVQVPMDEVEEHIAKWKAKRNEKNQFCQL